MTDPYLQQPYGQPQPRPHPRGTTTLILGIIGLVICAPLGIVAVVMGTNALREIDANPAAYTNRSVVNAGRILGIIAIALWVIGAVIGFLTRLGGS